MCVTGAWALDAGGVVGIGAFDPGGVAGVGILAEFMSHHELFAPFACLRINDVLSDNF